MYKEVRNSQTALIIADDYLKCKQLYNTHNYYITYDRPFDNMRSFQIILDYHSKLIECHHPSNSRQNQLLHPLCVYPK